MYGLEGHITSQHHLWVAFLGANFKLTRKSLWEALGRTHTAIDKGADEFGEHQLSTTKVQVVVGVPVLHLEGGGQAPNTGIPMA